MGKLSKKVLVKKIVYMLAGIVLLVSAWEVSASQTDSKLKETGKTIDELQQKKEDAEAQVGNLKEQETGLQGELAGLNQQLTDVTMQMNDLEQQIEGKEAAIEETGLQLQEAKNIKEQQYERMKLRIRFIYENGGGDIADIFLASDSMSDFINRAEYVEAINRYDRRMLDSYEETCRQVAEKEQSLKTEKAQLLDMQEDMKQKETKVNGLIAQTQNSISNKQEEITKAQDAVEEYEDQIEKMKAYEAELEKKKAEEAKKKAEAEKKKKEQEMSQISGGGTVSANASDLAMLAALVECESGGESYEGQWAVASVVVNRVRSARYPNTVSGVIYQSGQFSPVASGRFAVVLARGARASCVKAAQTALSGSTNINALSFCSASYGVPGTVIGNHVFY